MDELETKNQSTPVTFPSQENNQELLSKTLNNETIRVPIPNRPGGVKKLLIFFVLFLVIIAVGYFVYSKDFGRTTVSDKKTASQVEPKVASERRIETLTGDEVSKYFPADLPITSALKVLGNENVYYSRKGAPSTQIIRKYISPNDSAKSYSIFESYFSKNGWQIYYSSSKNTLPYEIDGYKSGNTLGVTIENSDASTSIVTLIMTTK